MNQTWQMPGPTWAHDAGVGMNLIEGNEGTGFIEDAIHGTHDFSTVFRNQYSGLIPREQQQTVPIILQSYSRYDNLIGNVLGLPATTTCTKAARLRKETPATQVSTIWDGPVPSARTFRPSPRTRW